MLDATTIVDDQLKRMGIDRMKAHRCMLLLCAEGNYYRTIDRAERRFIETIDPSRK